jgi:phasin family protein
MAESNKSKPAPETATPATAGSAMSFMPDFDLSKMFGDMKLPAAMPGMEPLMGAYRRNMEALAEANRVALEGAQAVARRNMEIMQKTMAEMTDQLRNMSATDAPQARASKQADMLKQAYESAVANLRELGDLVQRSNGEAVEKLNRRFSEAMDEMKQLIDKTPSGNR